MPFTMTPKRFLTSGTLIAVLACSLYAPTGNAGKRLYRWVDDQGNVHYSDQVPADQSRPEKSILNERGMTVDKIEAAKTAEQLAEEKRQRQLAEERRRQQEEQAAYDRMLLNTFQSESDIIHARDSKIAAVENVIRISETTLHKLEQQQRDLVQRAANAERSGQAVPEELSQDIEQVREQIDRTKQYIERKHEEQAQIRKRYEQDIQRYRELKAEMSQQ